MKKLFAFIFVVVLLISFAYSLPEPPPVPGMTNTNSSNTYSSGVSGSTSPAQSTSSYSTQSYSDNQGFFGGIGTMLLVGGSFSWFRFFLLFGVFIMILFAIIYLNMQRKKSLLNNPQIANLTINKTRIANNEEKK